MIGCGQGSVIPCAEMEVTDLLTDSRSLLRPEGTLFFALETGRDNGHRFIPGLYARGVRMFVVSEGFEDAALYPEAAFIRVADTSAALRRLAEAHRLNYTCPVVGITGSMGKTMVKAVSYTHLTLPTKLEV